MLRVGGIVALLGVQGCAYTTMHLSSEFMAALQGQLLSLNSLMSPKHLIMDSNDTNIEVTSGSDSHRHSRACPPAGFGGNQDGNTRNPQGCMILRLWSPISTVFCLAVATSEYKGAVHNRLHCSALSDPIHWIVSVPFSIPAYHRTIALPYPQSRPFCRHSN